MRLYKKPSLNQRPSSMSLESSPEALRVAEALRGAEADPCSSTGSAGIKPAPVRAHSQHTPAASGDGETPPLPPRNYKSASQDPGSDIQSRIHAFENISGPTQTRSVDVPSRPGAAARPGGEYDYTQELRKVSQSRFVGRMSSSQSFSSSSSGQGQTGTPGGAPSSTSSPENKRLLETDVDVFDSEPRPQQVSRVKKEAVPPPKPPKMTSPSSEVTNSRLLEQHMRQGSGDRSQHSRQGSYSPDLQPLTSHKEQSPESAPGPEVPPRMTTSPRGATSPLAGTTSPRGARTVSPLVSSSTSASQELEGARSRRPRLEQLRQPNVQAEISFPPPPSQEASPEQDGSLGQEAGVRSGGKCIYDSRWGEGKKDPADEVLRYLQTSENSAFTSAPAERTTSVKVTTRSTTFLPIDPEEPVTSSSSAVRPEAAKPENSDLKVMDSSSKVVNNNTEHPLTTTFSSTQENSTDRKSDTKPPLLIRDFSHSPRSSQSFLNHSHDDGTPAHVNLQHTVVPEVPDPAPEVNDPTPEVTQVKVDDPDEYEDSGEEESEEVFVPGHIRQKSQEELLCDTKMEYLAKKLGHSHLGNDLGNALIRAENQKNTKDYLEGVFDEVLKKSVRKSRGSSRGGSEKSDSLTGGVENELLQHRHNSSIDKSSISTKSESPFSDNQQATLTADQGDLDGEADLEGTLTSDLDSEQHRELICSIISKKLTVLSNEKEVLEAALKDNESTIEEVSSAVEDKCVSRDKKKFVKFIEDIEPITNLVLNLSRRLAKAENELLNAPEERTEEEKMRLIAKRDKIRDQHRDAISLKEQIDKRRKVVATILQKHLSSRLYRNYDQYVTRKMKLLMERNDVEDQTSSGQEQLRAFQNSRIVSVK